MDQDITYKENYERTIEKESLENFIREEEEIYNCNFGWTVGPIHIEEIDERRIKVKLTLTKRSIEENTYKETIIKTLPKNEYNRFISLMYEQYPEELGWNIGEPLINELNQTDIIVRVPLTNQSKSKNL